MHATDALPDASARISGAKIPHTTTAIRTTHRSSGEDKFFPRHDTRENEREVQEVGKQDIQSLKKKHLDLQELPN